MIFSFFFSLNDFLPEMLPNITKKWEKLINCRFYSRKTTFLAIFVNFGQLWMVVYTAIFSIV